MAKKRIPTNKSLVRGLPGLTPGSKLTFAQMTFVREYLSNGRNVTEAYTKAYSNANRYHAARHGRGLLKLPKIREIIDAADAKVMGKTETIMEKYAISEARIIEELARIAFSDPRQTAEWSHEDGVKIKSSTEITDEAAGAISEVAQTRDGIKIKNYDKQQALLALGKHLGMFSEKIDHRHLLAGKLVIEG